MFDFDQLSEQLGDVDEAGQAADLPAEGMDVVDDLQGDDLQACLQEEASEAEASETEEGAALAVAEPLGGSAPEAPPPRALPPTALANAAAGLQEPMPAGLHAPWAPCTAEPTNL
jgi:hypothetical protein